MNGKGQEAVVSEIYNGSCRIGKTFPIRVVVLQLKKKLLEVFEQKGEDSSRHLTGF